jgi:hypothetical protein
MFTGNFRASGLCFPIEIRADISAALTACFTDEAPLDVGQPHPVRPPVAADGNGMAGSCGAHSTVVLLE